MRTILLRLEDDLHDRVKTAAAIAHRSVNSEIIVAIENHLTAVEGDQP